MTPVAPRIVNNVSYVTRINHESLFAWQAQYSVMLEKHLCCSAHCKEVKNVSCVMRLNHESHFVW